jgi:Family of unknown function (DUF6368)
VAPSTLESMTGPVVDVLPNPELSRSEARAVVEAAAHTLGFELNPPQLGQGPDAFAQVQTSVGTPIDVCLVPADRERERGELEVISQRLGYRPSSAIQFLSWESSVQDRDLGRLALMVLERTGGFLDLGGPLAPPQPGNPGQIVEIHYQTWSGDLWVYHLVDSVFLRVWLDDPEFRLAG